MLNENVHYYSVKALTTTYNSQWSWCSIFIAVLLPTTTACSISPHLGFLSNISSPTAVAATAPAVCCCCCWKGCGQPSRCPVMRLSAMQCRAVRSMADPPIVNVQYTLIRNHKSKKYAVNILMSKTVHARVHRNETLRIYLQGDFTVQKLFKNYKIRYTVFEKCKGPVRRR